MYNLAELYIYISYICDSICILCVCIYDYMYIYIYTHMCVRVCVCMCVCNVLSSSITASIGNPAPLVDVSRLKNPPGYDQKLCAIRGYTIANTHTLYIMYIYIYIIIDMYYTCMYNIMRYNEYMSICMYIYIYIYMFLFNHDCNL